MRSRLRCTGSWWKKATPGAVLGTSTDTCHETAESYLPFDQDNAALEDLRGTIASSMSNNGGQGTEMNEVAVGKADENGGWVKVHLSQRPCVILPPLPGADLEVLPHMVRILLPFPCQVLFSARTPGKGRHKKMRIL